MTRQLDSNVEIGFFYAFFLAEYLDHLNLRLRRDAEEQESRDIEDDVNELDYKLK